MPYELTAIVVGESESKEASGTAERLENIANMLQSFDDSNDIERVESLWVEWKDE